jgi:transcriptional regulator with GAF, ATPase, and Fis domain
VPGIDPQNLSASLDRLRTDGDSDFNATIDRTVTACVDLFGVDGSGLMIADEQNTLRYVVSSDGPGRVLEEVQSRTGQGPCVDTFVHGHPVHTDDMAAETRWQQSRDTLLDHGVLAVLGAPVKLEGTPVGSLDVYRRRPYAWDESEQEALVRYTTVIEATLRTVLTAHSATELARQLQYALDNRVLIERAVGFAMAVADIDASTAFNLLRTAARGHRRRVADVAREVLETRALPPTHR